MNSDPFVSACQNNDWATVKNTATVWWRLRHRKILNEGFVAACRAGHTQLVRNMLAWANPRYNNDKPLRMAALNNHIGCVLLLLPHVPANTCEGVCVMGAIQRGDLPMLQLLLPLSAPYVTPNNALEHAAKNGQVEVVRWLLPLSDPHYRKSVALRNALKNNHQKVVEVLLPVSDCLTARKEMVNNGMYAPIAHAQLENFINTELLRARLEREVHSSVQSSPKRKM